MLKLKIVSPEKVVFKGDVESVLVPGTLGSFEILTDHAPLISSLSGSARWNTALRTERSSSTFMGDSSKLSETRSPYVLRCSLWHHISLLSCRF